MQERVIRSPTDEHYLHRTCFFVDGCGVLGRTGAYSSLAPIFSSDPTVLHSEDKAPNERELRLCFYVTFRPNPLGKTILILHTLLLLLFCQLIQNEYINQFYQLLKLTGFNFIIYYQISNCDDVAITFKP